MSDTEKTSAGPSRSLLSAGGLLLVLVILALFNLLLGQASLRWDLTEDNIYSLSEGSRKILSELERDVTLQIYHSEDDAQAPMRLKTYARRAIDFIREYESASDGRVNVEVIDAEPDSEAEEWAVTYGVNGVDLPTGDRFYFGLVALSADQEETIPMLDPAREEQLEYEVTRTIWRVQAPKRTTIGVISGLPIFGGPPQNPMGQPRQSDPWLFIQELRKTYEVTEIAADAEEIPGDVDVLLAVHPTGLSDSLVYAIDQFVLRGGNLMAFVDPLPVTMGQEGMGGPGGSDGLNRLLPAWGIEWSADRVLVDFGNATQLRGQNNQIEDNPLWISLAPEAFSQDAILTAQLESLLMPMAGTLSKAEDAPGEYETLVRSSANSSTIGAMEARFAGDNLRRDFSATPDRYDLAVRVRGTFKSAFPDGKPSGETDAEGEAAGDEAAGDGGEHLAEAAAPATVVVVSDADMLFDNFYVQRQNFLGMNISRMFNDNLNFLLNGGELLAGNDALIGIRSRGKFERPFTRVEALERRAQERWLAREQELMRKVDETNRKLEQLERQKDGSQEFIMSAEQEAEIQQFQQEKARINRELKEVRRNLRADIETLGGWVKFLNIFGMVLVVAMAGLAFGLYQRRQSGRG
ncbi:MAG: Gldg family protein [Desulfococcaceae bacterium]